MSKRRRTSSIASRGQDDDLDESLESAATSSGQPGRKRKKLDPVAKRYLIFIKHLV